jgi:alpha-glucosidase
MKSFPKASIVFCLLIFCLSVKAQKQIQLSSPDNSIKVSIDIKDKIYYTVSANNEVLLKDCYLQLFLKNETLGQQPKLQKQQALK